MQAVKFHFFHRPLPGPPPPDADAPPLLVSSFGEGRALELVNLQQEWIEHNTQRISRVYPKGTRIDSTNISDTLACRLWEAGVQMVALNWQALALPDPTRDGPRDVPSTPPLLRLAPSEVLAPGTLPLSTPFTTSAPLPSYLLLTSTHLGRRTTTP